MKYPMRCPECSYETESPDVPMQQGPPVMYCLSCALPIGQPGVLIRMRKIFTPAAAIFRGSGWGSK